MKKAIVPKRIIISRTDSIGDVVLTLPMCAAIKEKYPDCHLIFLAAAYTVPVLESAACVDEILNWTEISNVPTAQKVEALRECKADVIIHVFPNREVASLAKKARIEFRIGTSHRPYHLLSCNVPVSFTRKKSDLHESQLNFQLALPIGLTVPSFDEVSKGKYIAQNLDEILANGLEKGKSVILHPKSQGSAVEWPLNNFVDLASRLASAGLKVFVSGTEKEGQTFRDSFNWTERIIDTSGKMSLKELISFIGKADMLVACSTGPLHLAGATGIAALGLFSPKRPIHPGRWKPLGEKSNTLVSREECPCKKEACTCINDITVDQVFTEIASTLNA